MIYKLVEVERGGRVLEAAKLTRLKTTYPGRKQVLRYSKRSGEFQNDKIVLESERDDGGEPLLVEVMRQGRRVGPAEAVPALRERSSPVLPACRSVTGSSTVRPSIRALQ